MDKRIKELISKNKLTDDQILKALQTAVSPSAESQTADSESDDEESDDVEEPAQETGKESQTLTKADLQKLIEGAVETALKKQTESDKLPSQKPLPQDQGKGKPKPKDNAFKIGGFQLIG